MTLMNDASLIEGVEQLEGSSPETLRVLKVYLLVWRISVRSPQKKGAEQQLV